MRHRLPAFLLAVIMLISLLAGCDTQETTPSDTDVTTPSDTEEPPRSTNDDGSTALWVLVDSDEPDRITKTTPPAMVQKLAEEYTEIHDGITIEVEFLPTDAEERQTRIEQLRTQIMAGHGPDVYILPTGQLFNDVEQSMRNGLFADISAYFDTDEDLHREELEPTVMDAGLVGGVRYVLPIRYTFPVVYIDDSQLEASGLSIERMSGSVTGLFDEVTSNGDPKWAKCAWPMFYHNAFSVFSETIDYSGQTVLLTEGLVAEYLRSAAQVRTLASQDTSIASIPKIGGYTGTTLLDGSSSFALGGANSPYADGLPLYAGALENVLDIVAVGQAVGMEVTMFPLRATDGSLIANVTYWGAVGASSKNPELAYDFLRRTLLEDFQWEESNGTTATNGNLTILPGIGLCASGWPVRNAGSTEALWALYKRQLNANLSAAKGDATARIRDMLQNVDVTTDDIPLLDAQIDEVRFYIPQEGNFYTTILSLSEAADVEALAVEVVSGLKYHLAEG